VSGAILAAPAAYAEEGAPAEVAQPAEAPAADAPAAETPAPEAPATKTPETQAPETQVPAPETPAEGDSAEDDPEQGKDDPATEGKSAPKSSARSGASLLDAATPSLSVTAAPRAGGEVTVTGSGYDVDNVGVYIAIGPSGLPGFYMGSSSLIETVWVAEGQVEGVTAGGERTAALNSDGTFSVTFDVPAFVDGKSYALYTSKAHGKGFSDPSQNVIKAIRYALPDPSGPTKPKASTKARAAGSLSWGISSGFAGYTTGDTAKGSISTNGVGKSGGNFLFPQAAGSSWNFNTQTGTVRYSGVVTFSGHHGLMSETYANPVIRVTSASSGTLTVHGQTLPLNLAKASKSVGAGGAVTWSNVPVGGGISGGGSSGGSSGGGSFAYNSLTFTVGTASTASFGSTAVTHPSQQNEAAPTAPTDTGITVLTPEDELVAGGEIEFEAEGFEADENDILVVLYSDPIVLDRNAGADENGKVRWIGTLPEDVHGEHTITLQGSTDAGATVNIMTQEEYDAAHAEDLTVTSGDSGAAAQAAGPVAVDDGTPMWVVWTGVIALLVVAGGMTALVVAQRRRNGV